MFLAAPAEPHERRALCRGLSPKETICPPKLGPATPTPRCYCGVDVAQQAVAVKPHLLPFHQHTSLCLPDSIYLQTADGLSADASLWERGRKMVRRACKSEKVLRELGGVQIESPEKIFALSGLSGSVRVHVATLSPRNRAAKEQSR